MRYQQWFLLVFDVVIIVENHWWSKKKTDQFYTASGYSYQKTNALIVGVLTVGYLIKNSRLAVIKYIIETYLGKIIHAFPEVIFLIDCELADQMLDTNFAVFSII